MYTTKEITELIRLRANEVKAQASLKLVHKALQPLEYLNPLQVLQVREQFRLTFGVELESYIRHKVEEICRGEVPKYVELLIANRLSGRPRLRLKAELAEIFALPDLAEHEKLRGSVLPALYQSAQPHAKALRSLLSDKSLSGGCLLYTSPSPRDS